ncbi:MAG TPA: TylF/MycF/NovP-related O-methyltransferase [Bryobacteraceae bacterium]|nr:TylF/MycF/NovP-related O-methyltransferase [Bryobacteraceae bacterium]
MIKDLLRRMLAKAGYTVVNRRWFYAADGLFTVHNDHFRHGAKFREAYRRGIQAADGADPDLEWRLHVALWAASAALRVPGDFVECGVNKGFISSAILQRLDWSRIPRHFYLIDTFSGPILSQFSEGEVGRGRRRVAEDAIARGAYETDVERVRANFSEWPNALVVQGGIPEILPAVQVSRVAFLHLDMNCALPERAALEHFWPKLSPGGFVLLDDYAYREFEAQMESMDELAGVLGFEILSLPTGQGLIIKG